ncbi:NADH-quinone oxidoreductase subunit L [bacterium]|nr:NADH-quinone oxidoreductase subunit L [bacterium]
MAAFVLLGAPLLGWAGISLKRTQLSATLAGGIATAAIAISFAAAVYFMLQLTTHPTILLSGFQWISVGATHISLGLQLDSLSILMSLMITGIGGLIHLYAIGYMHDDPEAPRFFATFNLFVFFMLALVTSDNLIGLFFGWEGVGLCSFLLIGFWYKTTENTVAATKAFVMNRIGDLGLLIGILITLITIGSVSYSQIFAGSPLFPGMILGLIAVCLFIGAIGKSAQFPLFTWLPDAMAGPTPVSALIHAATMVTAGVYLVSRFFFLFSPTILTGVLWVGLFTSLIAGIVALAQTDIKKVLAYSTVSQLGIMVVALGMGLYSAALFHMLTHAFFKALLFLGAGSVIHGLHGEQDIRSMGGIRKQMPVTFVTFTIGVLAIMGLPPFAGFFSKDAILLSALDHSRIVFGLLGLTSILTVLYMARLWVLIFLGSYRGNKTGVHESPSVMTIPLVLLAMLSIIGGGLNFAWGPYPHFLDHVLSSVVAVTSAHHDPAHQVMLTIATVLIIGVVLFVMSQRKAPSMQENTFQRAVRSQFYLDDIYSTFIVEPYRRFAIAVNFILERWVFIGGMAGIGHTGHWVSRRFRKLQSGSVSAYIIVMVMCVVLVLMEVLR